MNKSARVGVIGLGYVGLPHALLFAKTGYQVIGLDINSPLVMKLNGGTSHIKDIPDSSLKEVLDNGSFTASTDFSIIKELDSISICVPTPLNKLKDPDVSYILSVLDDIEPYVHKNMLVILESTTYPGTTRELVLPVLEENGLKVGKDIFLCFAPERIDPGNSKYNLKNTPKVVGGITPNCTKVGQLFFEQVIDAVIPVSTPESAEMVKLLENTFRSINIGLVNEIAIMCEKLGIDVWEVIEAADSKPFGFMKFTPGPGLGGHCIPVDPHYLAWKLKSFNYKARFIELAGEINTSMPHHVVDLIKEALNQSMKAVKGSRILLSGIAYKRDIDDIREAPALDVLKLLEEGGASVSFFDPFVQVIPWTDSMLEGLTAINSDVIKSYDVVVILTDHSNIDYDLILKSAQKIVDTRNVFNGINSSKIIRLGVGNQK
jgi:UDP-N-acetyl-D-glucosamine dehydrogenase